jgi:cytochrome c-type biogenesis protein CcmH/NrfG
MTKGGKTNGAWVKKETMLLVAFICLVIGFVGGIAFSVYKQVPALSDNTGRKPTEMAQFQPSGPTEEQLSMIRHLEKEAAQNPRDLQQWIQLGNAYFDTHQAKQAIQAYIKALELSPNNADVWTDLGIMYRRDGQPDKAIDAFDKAIAADPRHEPSRFNKGLVLMHDLNDRDGAIKAWEGLIEINPDAVVPGGKQPIKQLLDRLKSIQ